MDGQYLEIDEEDIGSGAAKFKKNWSFGCGGSVS